MVSMIANSQQIQYLCVLERGVLRVRIPFSLLIITKSYNAQSLENTGWKEKSECGKFLLKSKRYDAKYDFYFL